MKIILGSQSAGRKSVLKRMGYAFDVISPNIDEKSIRFDDPTELTLALAHAKAQALIPKIAEPAILITSDQVVVCNGVIREKPESRDEATAFLKSYADYPAQTVTSVVVTNTETHEQAGGTDIATIYFNPIPDEVISQYIDTGDPFNHAGGFDHEHPLLVPWVKKIEGEPESIVGLPRTLTTDLMKRVGFLNI